MPELSSFTVAVIGGGPAGLMAAEVMSRAGVSVDLYDAMPSVGRKFLLAGIGGLNITHSEDYALFCSRYADRQAQLQPMLDHFPPDALRRWVKALGVDTFVGTSGRVFPSEMKAAPLLRAWLRRLREQGVRTHTRHRWLGWTDQDKLRISTTTGDIELNPHATVLALGGASWPQLGSDGAWVPWLRNKHVMVHTLESANCGFEVAWSDYIRQKFAGVPLKSVALAITDLQGQRIERPGELVISAQGVEGSLIYAFSRPIRQLINANGRASFTLDLLPGRTLERVSNELTKPRNGHSLPSFLKNKVGISGVKLALLHEVLSKAQLDDTPLLANTLKALPITVTAPRPIAEAISTAGGVSFDSLDQYLMIKSLPSTFVAGEMLDWEAPTGGYLLTACLASGLAAGQGVLRWLAERSYA